LNPLRHVIEGKRLIVVDDSIVRGNTQRALVRMLRDAGAAEVHVRIASPPVKWPCFYGIDFPSPNELLANNVDQNNMVEAMREEVGADSLGFVSTEAMVETSAQPRETLCAACFDGVYPLGLPPGKPSAAQARRRPRRRAEEAARTAAGWGWSNTRGGSWRLSCVGAKPDFTCRRKRMSDDQRTRAGASYAAAGVDIEAGDRAVGLLAPLAKRATRPEVRGGLGGFAGLFALGEYDKPLLAASSDGVGTKLAVAQAMDKHD